MNIKASSTIKLAALYGSNMFLQFCTLWLANRAGTDFLSVEAQEKVYYYLQLFVIAGFLLFAAVCGRAGTKARVHKAAPAALAVFACGFACMLFAPHSTAYLAVTFLTVFALGFFGSAVYLRMAEAMRAGEPAAAGFGCGYAAAILMQYVFQIRWLVRPLLLIVAAAAFALLCAMYRATDVYAPGAEGSDAGPSSGAAPSGAERGVLLTCICVTAFLLLISFYNSYIHHLQISSGYTDYNVYSWPRLMMIPGSLLFAYIGERRNGRFVSIAALCIALAALMNIVLSGSSGSYWLNMCLFYIALSSIVAYYNISFCRLAASGRRPALTAPLGRILDSAVVLLSWGISLLKLPQAGVLAADLICIAVIIVVLALNGDFSLKEAEVPQPVRLPGSDERLAMMAERYSLTPKEASLLRELVTTEDKQEAIASRLSVSISTVQFHTTSIYRKTGAKTRSGLSELFHSIS